MSNELILKSHGSDVPYKIVSGGFDVTENGKLHLSVELEILDEENEDVPPEILFAVVNADYDGPGKTIKIVDRHETWDGDDGLPHAYVYSGFHHEAVTAQVEVHSHDSNQMELNLTVITNDVSYYDERARDNAIVGQITLPRKDKNDQWGP